MKVKFPQTQEYKTLVIPVHEVDKTINDMVADGWRIKYLQDAGASYQNYTGLGITKSGGLVANTLIVFEKDTWQ